MAGFNQVVLMGKLVREPELKYAKGMPVCRLRLLVPRFYKSREGEPRNDSLFIDVVVWRRMAEICQQFLHRNSEIMVSGRLQMNQWTGQDGRKRTDYRVQSERIQFLGKKEAQDASGEDPDEAGEQTEPEAA